MKASLRMMAAVTLSACAFGAAAQGTYQLRITDPVDDAVVSPEKGALVTRSAVVPPLGGGDRLELLLDGTPVAKPGDQLEFQLTGIGPGLHVLQTRIIDASGNVSGMSEKNILTVVDDMPPRAASPEVDTSYPILDSRWGPGDVSLPVARLRFELR